VSQVHWNNEDLMRARFNARTRIFRETFILCQRAESSRIPGFTRKLLPNYGNQETFRYTRSTPRTRVYMVNYRAWPAGSAARGTCIRFQGRICPVARGLIERGLAGRRRRYQRVLQIMRARMQPRIDRGVGERERESDREGGKRWSLRPRALARTRTCACARPSPNRAEQPSVFAPRKPPSVLRPSRASFDPPAYLRYRARRRRIALRIARAHTYSYTRARTVPYARPFQGHRMITVQLNRI